jgi:hypothetical protein
MRHRVRVGSLRATGEARSMMRTVIALAFLMGLASLAHAQSPADTVPVTVQSFTRAESDNYLDGSGGVPIGQFCYYTSPSEDQSTRRVDLAFDGVKQMQIGMDLVPEVDAAFSKCQWWKS